MAKSCDLNPSKTLDINKIQAYILNIKHWDQVMKSSNHSNNDNQLDIGLNQPSHA